MAGQKQEAGFRDRWGGDKPQVSPVWLTAFGIRIGSRYGNSSELVDLLRVARELAWQRLEDRVQEIFRDSKGGSYNIILTPGPSDQRLEERIIEIIQEDGVPENGVPELGALEQGVPDRCLLASRERLYSDRRLALG